MKAGLTEEHVCIKDVSKDPGVEWKDKPKVYA